jgi:hypothetical protein
MVFSYQEVYNFFVKAFDIFNVFIKTTHSLGQTKDDIKSKTLFNNLIG